MVFCLLLAGGVGYGTYSLGLSWYTANKSEEKTTALQLVDAFVTNYSDLRVQFGAEPVPVPATFRAHSIELFNQMRGSEDALRLLWVGRVGRAIATPPADAAMAETIEGFASEPNPKTVSRFLTTPAGLVFRTDYPSIATQQSCVDCHNALQPNQAQWHLNDVMGAFSIDVPAGPFLRANLAQSSALGLGVFLALGGVGLFVAVQSFRQLAEREVTQARLKASEERFRDFAESSSDWFWEQDESLRFIGLSDPVERSGLSIAAHIGKTRQEVVFYGVTDEQWRQHQDDLDAHRPFHDFRFQRLAPSGEFRHISVSGKPVFDEKGAFKGYRGTARDVTVEHTATAALRRAKEDAETASKAKSDFLATMSHELRTPLNAIIGFSEMMLAEIHGPLGERRYRGYTEDIHQSGRHLLDIINDILDLSKAEAGKLELTDVLLDPRAVIEGACRLIGARADTAGLVLVTKLSANLPLLRADERVVKQILLNLLSNAVKFTPVGGVIEISASVEAHGGVTITVCDTGIGIAAEHLSTALEPFGQVDSSLSRSHQGTGLGLPLAAAMIERHGGTLQLESTLGRGTTVAVTFPPERIVATPAVA